MKLPSLCIPACSVLVKILLVFLLLSVISLLVCGIVAFATIGEVGFSAQEDSIALGNQALDDASRALRQETERHLIQTAYDQAEITNVLFEDTITEMEILAAQARTNGHNPQITPLTPVFTREKAPQDPYGATVIFPAPGAESVRDTEEYRILYGMSDPLKAVYDADTNMTSVYITTDSGITLMYPWRSFANGTIDPRSRDWFTGAKNAGTVYWSGPYIDSAGHGLVMTASRAVSTKYGTWVVGSDVTVDVISSSFLNKTLGGRGYAVLMDNRGTIISRPGLSNDGIGNGMAYIPENALNSNDPSLVAISRNMTSGKTGIEVARFNGEDTFVAYAPVNALNWSFAVSLPVAEVTAPIDQTRERIAAATLDTSARINEQTDRIRDIFTALILVVIGIVAILAVLLARMITRPVEALKEGASALGNGDLDYRVQLETHDEFEDLAHSFNRMAGDLKKNIADLKRTTAEKERYTKELEIAKEIQLSFLPEEIPQIKGFELAATTIPAMEIGGDLYDFIPLNSTNWAFVIADVSGKSISAALYMALSRTLLHASGNEHPDPTPAIQWVNRMLFDDGRSGMFITVFYAVLDPVRKRFSYVNAGHNPPLILRAGEQTAQFLEGKGIALGVLPEVDAESNTITLKPGDLVILYTDGVTEAFNEEDKDFGEERLIQFIETNRMLPVNDLMGGLLDEIRRFRGDAPQSDDITLLVFRVL